MKEGRTSPIAWQSPGVTFACLSSMVRMNEARVHDVLFIEFVEEANMRPALELSKQKHQRQCMTHPSPSHEE